ncbi:MAG TPA: GGDEF domain-containing protein [Steroidobacteraceae bacterium]|nr:GGDEF domain-containing protein [Steroidobacteraceae bacterium]
MSQIVDYLAEITGFRDREMLDVTLAAAFREMLQPLSVAIYRTVGEAHDLRWVTRARQRADDLVASADPIWAKLAELPRVAEYPERCRALAGEIVQSERASAHVCLFPLAADREIVGVLEVESTAPLDADAQNLIRGVLQVYRNFQSVLDYGERDTLTGLLNRKTFDENFYRSAQVMLPAAEVERRRKGPESRRWVGMIDIDFFKAVNDKFGHLIGDEVLLLLSRLMRSSFRIEDQLYRFGGEEFVVLLQCDSAADAALVFERFRANVAGHHFPQVGYVTISVGFTEIIAGDCPTSALGRADRAVYHAKASGRNQVRQYEKLVADGQLDGKEMARDVELY